MSTTPKSPTSRFHWRSLFSPRFLLLFGVLFAGLAYAAEDCVAKGGEMTNSVYGIICLVIFVVAYTLVILEEKLHLSKSKPVLAAAGAIWVFIAIYYKNIGTPEIAEEAMRATFLEYAELFFFLLVAMTYINAMIERGVFAELRNWLTAKGFSYRILFWVTGLLAFFISPIADNLTTALIMCAVVLAVGGDKPSFVMLSCINIVIGANAGGAFSPFGDITTLMVWQKGMLSFWHFFKLFIPAVVNFALPALIMQFAIPKGRPEPIKDVKKELKYGGLTVVRLFLITVITAVVFHNFLHLPPVFGMLTGLAYLKFYGYYLTRKSRAWSLEMEKTRGSPEDPYDFDIFKKIADAEWDTLFFFYGVVMAVGGLGFIGYLEVLSHFMYGDFGPTIANIMVGVLSSIVDNIPVMYAVLTMNPHMNEVQWLLVTFTAGVGGSLLSIGSAAGVALMGQARGMYTFFGHLRWMPVIALGYGAAIWVHFLING